jgi:hypothetical protein
VQVVVGETTSELPLTVKAGERTEANLSSGKTPPAALDGAARLA